VLEAVEADPDAFLETHPCGSFSETRFRETVLRDTEPHSTVVNDAVSGISQKRAFLIQLCVGLHGGPKPRLAACRPDTGGVQAHLHRSATGAHVKRPELAKCLLFANDSSFLLLKYLI
jgi:hypothetical protein